VCGNLVFSKLSDIKMLSILLTDMHCGNWVSINIYVNAKLLALNCGN